MPDFVRHYYLGHGEDLTLSEIGHLAGVIDYFLYKLNIYDRINAQIVAWQGKLLLVIFIVVSLTPMTLVVIFMSLEVV